MTDPIVEAVKADLDARSAKGIATYGTTLARTDLTHAQWTQYAYEEALDLALYLRRMMEEPRGLPHWQRLTDMEARVGAQTETCPFCAGAGCDDCGHEGSLPVVDLTDYAGDEE